MKFVFTDKVAEFTEEQYKYLLEGSKMKVTLLTKTVTTGLSFELNDKEIQSLVDYLVSFIGKSSNPIIQMIKEECEQYLNTKEA